MNRRLRNVIMEPHNVNSGPCNVIMESRNEIMRPCNVIMGPWNVNRGTCCVNK